MRFRRDNDDGGFGMGGMGGSFGTSGYDPHSAWEGPVGTRGVMRDDSRVAREHDDEHSYGGRGYRSYGSPYERNFHREHGGFSNYAGGGDRDRMSSREHSSESEARRLEGYRGFGAHAEQWHGGNVNGPPYPMEQRGFGQSQYPYNDVDDRGPHYGKGPKGYKRSDERIREEVCELLARQGFIDASDVEVTVEAGVVRLVGVVATRQEKRGLEQIADRVHGVDEVRNELRLRRDNVAASPQNVAQNAPQNVPASTRGPVSQNGKSAH